MTHDYTITGMTCGSCAEKVKNGLMSVPGVAGVEVSKENQTATVSMNSHLPLSALQAGLDKKYTIAEIALHPEPTETKSWLSAYKPILLIFGYLAVVSIVAATANQLFDWMRAMNTFMAGFFLVFSFFKLLDLKGFAESYAMYDIAARRIKAWGYIYPFVELSLGIAYLTGFQPLLTNIVTFLVMTVSLIGVWQSVMNKRRIQCACLGVVFNLPMSTVTIIEDGLMIAMSVIMVVSLYG